MARPFDPDTVLSRPLIATLASLASDGAPRTAPVWFIWEDDALWMLSDVSASSARRIAKDPRVSVDMTDFDVTRGILLHLGLRGSAQLVAMDPARFRRLLTKYLGPEDGWNPWFIKNIARIDDPDGRLIRLAPDSLFTNDVSYFRTGPDLATRPG